MKDFSKAPASAFERDNRALERIAAAAEKIAGKDSTILARIEANTVLILARLDKIGTGTGIDLDDTALRDATALSNASTDQVEDKLRGTE